MSVPLKLPQSDVDFLEKFASKIELETDYYYMPYWFRRVKGNVFEMLPFDKLPNNVKEFINKTRNGKE